MQFALCVKPKTNEDLEQAAAVMEVAWKIIIILQLAYLESRTRKSANLANNSPASQPAKLLSSPQITLPTARIALCVIRANLFQLPPRL